MSYDLATDIGKVRLYIQDANSVIFSDDEIQVFLDDTGSVILAAARAFRIMAANKDRLALAFRTLTFYKDTRQAYRGLLEAAESLEALDASTPAAGVAELSVTDDNAIRIMINRLLREQ